MLITSTLQSSAPCSLKIKVKMNLVGVETKIIIRTLLLWPQSKSVQTKVSSYLNRNLLILIHTTAKILAINPVRDFRVWPVQTQIILYVLKPMTLVFILILSVMVILSVLVEKMRIGTYVIKFIIKENLFSLFINVTVLYMMGCQFMRDAVTMSRNAVMARMKMIARMSSQIQF